MTQYGFALIGLTAFVGMLVAILTFALLKFLAAARDTKRQMRESGEGALLSVALQDAVTRLKAQEREMHARARASEALSGQIVDSLTAGLLMVSHDGIVEILNQAGERLLGVRLPRESLTTGADAALDYRRVLAGAPQLVEVIAECLQSAQPIMRRSIQVSSGDRVQYFGLTVSPLLGDAAHRGIICLFSDLTTVRELEEQLRLKETLAQLGELTAGIAHEFRNGLATIHGYGRLIDPDAVPPRYKPYVEGIRHETDALRSIVTNFLKFARPEQVTLAPVDVEAVATRAIDDLRHELPAGASVSVDGTFGEIQGDEVALRQVFGNLVRNGVEAAAEAGRQPVVVVRSVADAGARTCRVSVDDNGPGVPESARVRIFQPFFTTRSRGTGLGLAIVLKIVVLHNGRISIGMSPEGGASMQMVFPLSSP